MAGEFGVSFSPTGKNDQQQDGGANATPIQDAIKVLSLKIPQFVGARGIAPEQLLGGPGSAGLPGMGGGLPGGLEDFLRRLFGQMGGGMGGGMAAPQGPPAPHIGIGGPIRQPPGASAGAPPDTLPGGILNPPSMAPSPGQAPGQPTFGVPKTPKQQMY